MTKDFSERTEKLLEKKNKIAVEENVGQFFSAQILVLLLGRSYCTHIYCMTSEKHHKTSQVEKSHTQYK